MQLPDAPCGARARPGKRRAGLHCHTSARLSGWAGQRFCRQWLGRGWGGSLAAARGHHHAPVDFPRRCLRPQADASCPDVLGFAELS